MAFGNFKICAFVLTFLSLAVQTSFAQHGPDIEVSVMPSSPTARGGEHFSYKATVRNRGDVKTSDVMLLTNDLRSAEFVTATPTQGTCEIERPRGENAALKCRFGDMAPESEVSVDVVVKFYDIDDESNDNLSDARLRSLEALAKVMRDHGGVQPPEVVPEELTATVWVAGRDNDFNRENNHADLRIKLLPSRNVRPQVKIINPQSPSTVVKRARSPFRLTIQIEANDPDGTVEKVTVQEPFNTPHPFVEDGQYKFRYKGKTFTAEELDEYSRTAPSDEKPASKTGPNTYEFLVTDVSYGINWFHISAVDNGGRHALTTTLELTVKGDAEVEIVSPKPDQIVEPGSDLVVETISKLNEGTVKELVLIRTPDYSSHISGPARLTQVSREGNTYKHRYVISQISAQDYANIHAVLIEDSGAISESPAISFTVTRIPMLSVVIDGGETFPAGTPIAIGFTSDAEMRDVAYEVHIDGKLRSDAFTQFIWNNAQPGKHVVEIVAKIKGSRVELARSKPVTIIVR